jgi:hypothetical protein
MANNYLSKHFPNFVMKARKDDDNLMVHGNNPNVVETGPAAIQDAPNHANVKIDGDPVAVQTEGLAKGPFASTMPDAEPQESLPKATTTLTKAPGDSMMSPKTPSAPKPTQGGAAGTSMPQQPQMGGNTAPKAPTMGQGAPKPSTGMQAPKAPTIGSDTGPGTGNHKYTSRSINPDGTYKYEYSGGVTGAPDAPAGSSPQDASAHHDDWGSKHGQKAMSLNQWADKVVNAPAGRTSVPEDHPQVQSARAAAQGHQDAAQYHRSTAKQHRASAGITEEQHAADKEQAHRMEQGRIYGWD